MERHWGREGGREGKQGDEGEENMTGGWTTSVPPIEVRGLYDISVGIGPVQGVSVKVNG